MSRSKKPIRSLALLAALSTMGFLAGLTSAQTPAPVSLTPSQYTVVGNTSGIDGGTDGDLMQVRFSLVNCGGATPIVPGVTAAIKGAKTFTSSANGSWSGLIWGNDSIGCNGFASTLYQVVYLRNNVPSGLPQYYRITAATDLTTATPVTILPPTHVLAQGITCPNTAAGLPQAMVGLLSNLTPVCSPFQGEPGPVGPAAIGTAFALAGFIGGGTGSTKALSSTSISTDSTGTNLFGIGQLTSKTSFHYSSDLPTYQNLSSTSSYFDDYVYNGELCPAVSGFSNSRSVNGVTGIYGGGGIDCHQTVQNVYGPGISYTGSWDVATAMSITQNSARRGISNGLNIVINNPRAGDSNFLNIYAGADGGTHTGSDEGIVGVREYLGQTLGYGQFQVNATTGTGDQDPVIGMTPYNGSGCTAIFPLGGAYCFVPVGSTGAPAQANTGTTSDGLNLVLVSSPLYTGYITGMSSQLVSHDTTGGANSIIPNIQQMPMAGGGTLPAITSMCVVQTTVGQGTINTAGLSSGNGAQSYSNRTYNCNLQTVTLPAGGTWVSAALVAGQMACFVDGYPEQAMVVSATTPSGGAQQVTLNIRNGHGASSAIVQNTVQGCMHLTYTGQLNKTGIRSNIYAYGSVDGANMLGGYINYGVLRAYPMPIIGFDDELVNSPNALTSVSRDSTGNVTAQIQWPFYGYLNQSTMASIVGCADPSFNINVPLFSVDNFNTNVPNPVHWTSTVTPAATTTGCSVTIAGMDGVIINRYAEIIYNKGPGAQPHLETNTVPWTVGAVAENPHSSTVIVNGEKAAYSLESAANPTSQSYGKRLSFVGTGWGGSATALIYENDSATNSYAGRGGYKNPLNLMEVFGDFGTLFNFDRQPINTVFNFNGNYQTTATPKSFHFIDGPFGTWTMMPFYTDQGGVFHRNIFTFGNADMVVSGSFQPAAYLNLPVASATVQGVVKAGAGISVAGDGTISTTGITASGTSCTITAITNGLITGAHCP